MERRLAAILAADIVGYARLMGADESGTLSALNKHRTELIEPKARQYKGRTVKLMGDGALMEFPSAVDAVAFATEVQCAMRERNEGVPSNRQIVYRVGINIGDIIIEGDDIFGDGVNIAARLEGLAEPGGICVARNVVDQVSGKLDLGFKLLGKRKVKNISRPVTVHRVVLDDKAALLVTDIQEAASVRGRWQAYAAVALVMLLIAGGIVWWQQWASGTTPAAVKTAPVKEASLPLPDKPSIAVLPFVNLSDDPKQEYFADGMTEDLITDLSKISALFVIGRNSSFVYKSQPTKVQQVAQELGVRYILKGSVRKVNEKVRINAQLIDTSSGGNLWADRYDGGLGDVFALQDKITSKIVDGLALKLTAGEEARSTNKDTDNPAAYDAFLQGWKHYLRFAPQDYEIAVGYFEKALSLDPGYARAYAALAATYWESWKRQWHGNVGFTHAAWARADEYLSKAMIEPSSLAHQVASEMLTINRRYDKAVAEARKAILLSPNRALGYVALAEALTYAGKANEAIEPIKKAMRLDPRSPAAYLLALGRAQFALSQFDEAVVTLERAVRRNPDNNLALVFLIAAYGHTNRSSEAADAVARLNGMRKKSGLSPFTLDTLRNRLPFKERSDRDRLVDGLRKAGLPEW